MVDIWLRNIYTIMFCSLVCQCSNIVLSLSLMLIYTNWHKNVEIMWFIYMLLQLAPEPENGFHILQ